MLAGRFSTTGATWEARDNSFGNQNSKQVRIEEKKLASKKKSKTLV